jgi:NTP pyrophosphatase (non-canonical NTP hydrolase)
MNTEQPAWKPQGLNQLAAAIEQWARDRKIIPNASQNSQFLKTVEEVGEIAAALARDKPDDLKDAIGDVVVCLVNLAALSDLTLEECVAHAYDHIKDRRGHMTPEGVFIKDDE